MDSCPCCQDPYQHKHERAHYLKLAHEQTNSAFREHERLKSLYGDVSWYNFEVKASRWKKPWPETDQNSLVCLVSLQESTVKECVFTPWYYGEVGLAPLLPHKIIANELKESLEEFRRAKYNENDADDYAPPNGKKYLELCRTTKVPTSLVY
jgi:hypothetical protein